MKFSTREDIEAPAEAVYAALTDFPAMERGAMRRGATVARRDRLAEPGPGMRWSIAAKLRGKLREFDLELVTMEPDTAVAAVAISGGMTVNVAVELVALSRARTRMQVGVDVRASSLPARLLLQSAKLAKSSLDRRFARRVAEFAAGIEARHAKATRTAQRQG